MTRASAARIAKRIEFIPSPPGVLSEQIDLIPFSLSLGLQHPEGSPLMIVAWDGQRFTHLLPEQAMHWADSLIEEGQAVPLAPVIAAIRGLVKRVGEIVAASIMREFETVH